MPSPRKFLILAKSEVTQFTDPTPTPAANSILVKNLNVTPLAVETEDRNLVRPYYGNSEQIPVSTQAVIEFDVEMAGSGTAATAPKYGPLLKACGFSETTSTNVVYAPISSGFSYVTIYCYRDGLLYKMTGCAGSVSIAMGAKRIPHFRFRFVGKYEAVTDAAIPGGSDFSGFKTPIASVPTNTGTVTIGAYAARLAELSIDLSNEVSYALWMNGNPALSIMDRKPKGTIVVEAVTVAAKNYFSDLLAGTQQAFTLTHGTVAGYMVQIDAPKMSISDIAEAEFEGALAFRMGVVLNPSAGNDEITITTK